MKWLFITLILMTWTSCQKKGKEDRAAACRPPPKVRICDLEAFAAKTGVNVSKPGYEPAEIMYRHATMLNKVAIDEAMARYKKRNPGCAIPKPVSNKSVKNPFCPNIEHFTSDQLYALKTAVVIHKRAPNWWNVIPDCPCSEVGIPPGWFGEPAKQEYHPGATTCYRSPPAGAEDLMAAGLDPKLLSPGQQCCYDESKKLITKGPAAGTPDLFAPVDDSSIAGHTRVDVELFKTLGHKTYVMYWPPNKGAKCPEN
ncbi:MAG: hypothetical protein GY854_26730 [Deltaproteobacteria bacterium]|nr:hypothetical protein [Deltaproteobacteria bacterium]